MRSLSLTSFASLLALAACSAPQIVPQPAPAPAPAPAPPPPSPPPPPPVSADWRDWPVAPGDWQYRRDGDGSVASFGRAGVAPELRLRCDKPRARILVQRRSNSSAPITIRASTTLKTYQTGAPAGNPPYVAAVLEARDPLLDAAGFSRGRILVQGGGAADLVVPSWPEILRVIEDCRS